MYIPFRRNISIEGGCTCITKYTREITCGNIYGSLTSSLKKMYYRNDNF